MCAEHAHDAKLLAGYRARHTEAYADVAACLDPADVQQATEPANRMPPSVGLFSAAVLSRLKELTADGPAVVNLDGHDVVIVREGDKIAEYPLEPVDPQPGLYKLRWTPSAA